MNNILSEITEIEFTVKPGLAIITKNGIRSSCEGDFAYELMRLCGQEHPSVSHIKHNAATIEEIEELIKNAKNINFNAH